MLNRYINIPDEELAVLSQNGDAQAEELLIRRYMDIIRAKARIYFIAGADSEDVIQEGMIGLYKAIRSYSVDKEASFATYAEVCINSQIITAIRAAARMKHEPLNTFISLSAPMGDENVTMEEKLCLVGDGDPGVEILAEDFNQMVVENKGRIFSKMEHAVLKMFMAGSSVNSPPIVEKLVGE